MTAAPVLPLPFQSVLVTGASGFVGRWLAPALAEALPAGARLTLCGSPPSVQDPDEARFVAVDLRAADQVRALVSDTAPDLVVHLAALSSVAQSGSDVALTWDVNLGASLALARELARLPAPLTLLFASSADVYGLTLADGPAAEDAPLRPTSPYAKSKAAAEAMLADVLRPTDRLIVARPSNHSGPGQDGRFVLPSFAEQIASAELGREPARIRVGDLSAERDFMDVRDVVDAYMALLRAAPTLPMRGTFNVATGVPVRIATLLEQLLARARVPITVERDPARMRPSDIPRAVLTPDRLHAATGWRARRPITDTLDALLQDRRGLAERDPGTPLVRSREPAA